MKFLILNGPNINMLGIREPEIYGEETYDALVEKVKEHAEEIGVEVEFFQSNHEGALIDEIQRAYFSQVDGIVFNPAGYTHTSVALADAVKAAYFVRQRKGNVQTDKLRPRGRNRHRRRARAWRLSYRDGRAQKSSYK